MKTVTKELPIIQLKSPYGDSVMALHDGLLFGNAVPTTKKHPTTGALSVSSILQPTRFKHRSRSRYAPHQGKQECARRVSKGL